MCAMKAEKPEVRLWEGLTRSDLISLDACTRCGQCIPYCPIQEASGQRDISPPEKITMFRQLLSSQRGARAVLFGQRPLDREKLQKLSDALYHCTVCGVCGEYCEVGINCMRLWPDMRHKMVELGVGPFGPQKDTPKTTWEFKNPYGQPHSERLAFLPPDVHVEKAAENGFYVGCSGAYPSKPMVAGAVRVLQAAGVPFTILDDEWCCGFPLWVVGVHDKVEQFVRHNVDEFVRRGVKRLITSCPCCTTMITGNWPRYYGKELPFEVVHTTEVVADALRRGKLKIREYRKKITYHDPCLLARGPREVIRPPREVLEYVPGLELVEMERHGRLSKCCGAGGGIRRANFKMSIDMANIVITDGDKLGVDEMLIDCPACFERMHLAQQQPDHPSDLPILDLMDVISRLV